LVTHLPALEFTMLQNVAALLLCGCFLPVGEDGVHQFSVSAPQTHRTSLSPTYSTAEEFYEPITAVYIAIACV